jgi:2-oxo-4-hydroxy-4-carboxy-5-ureidoimidazoline decarboxylase
MTLNDFNRLSVAQAKEELFKCCGSTSWVNKLMAHFPFATLEELKNISDQSWKKCSMNDWLEAFSHHPKIGEKAGAEKNHASTKEWAQQEQAGVMNAVEGVKAKLASANQLYENKFGYIFIVCATGKSADEMLSILVARLNNDPAKEIQIAAGEQNKITHLRMDKLFS